MALAQVIIMMLDVPTKIFRFEIMTNQTLLNSGLLNAVFTIPDPWSCRSSSY